MDGGRISSQQIQTVINSDATDDILTVVKKELPDDATIQALSARHTPDA
jgi:hypothetical protein